jgi:hypothetical protein
MPIKPTTVTTGPFPSSNLTELRLQYEVWYSDLEGRYIEEAYDGIEAAHKRQRHLQEQSIESDVWEVVR